MDGLAKSELAHLPRQPPQIARHERLHVGVGNRRGGALVLARLGAGLARQRHAHARADLGQDLPDPRLVCGIGVGVDQRHGHRLHVELGDAARDGPHRGFVQRPPHGAVHVHALRHREAQLARHQRPGLDDVDVVLVEAALVRDLDHVAEAVSRNERGARALALDDGVGGERGAVHEHADVAERQARLRQRAAGALDDGHLRLPRRRQQLGDVPAPAAEQHDVGERPADVDSQPGGPALLAHDRCPSFWVGTHQTPTTPPPARGRRRRAPPPSSRRRPQPSPPANNGARAPHDPGALFFSNPKSEPSLPRSQLCQIRTHAPQQVAHKLAQSQRPDTEPIELCWRTTRL